MFLLQSIALLPQTMSGWELRSSIGFAMGMLLLSTASAQTFFADSERFDYYDSGLAVVSAPSTLAAAGPANDKLPVDGRSLFDRDALQVAWTSQAGGDWSALIITPGFRFQNLSLSDTLGLWLYSEQVLAKADLPLLSLEGATGASRTSRYALGDFLASADGLPAGRWRHARIPLALLRGDQANAGFDFTRVKAVILSQGAPDGTAHTLLVDQVQIFNARAQSIGQLTSTALGVVDAPLHRDLVIDRVAGAVLNYAVVQDGELVKVLNASGVDTMLQVWLGPTARGAGRLRVTTYTPGFGLASGGPEVEVAALPALNDDEALWDMTQRSTLRYFWDFAHPVSGLARERNTSGNTVTIGGSGFGIMGWLVGIERGWLTREEVVGRLAGTLAFLEQADRFHGVWPHWMDGRTGRVIPFSPRDNGGDLVETAFMAQALLTARQYFDGQTPQEDSIRQRCTRLWEAIEWDWYQRPGEDVLTWHWSPNQAWAINLKIRGFNEAQIIYLLGIASPTHPIPASLYQTGWITNNYRSFQGRYGIFIPAGQRSGGPMFFAHYSYLGFDPRYWRDEFTNYFRRNQLHANYQVAYAADNPEGHAGYSRENWGFTASDEQGGYSAHAADENADNGTLTPTAALASMPYVSGAATAALRSFYSTYRERLFGPMGFYDAFNLDLNWFATSTLAIDQGPIIGMIENHRSGLLWKNYMANPEIAQGLRAAGFVPDSTTVGIAEGVLAKAEILTVWPNPVVGSLQLAVPESLQGAESLELTLYDVLGRVAFRQNLLGSPDATIALNVEYLSAGSYTLIIHATDPMKIYRATFVKTSTP